MLNFIVRAMVVNAAQLASYSQAKQAILGSGYIQVTISLSLSLSFMDKYLMFPSLMF